TELLQEKVEEGHDAQGPETDPEREGYTFIGWSKPITNITSNLTVIAQYEKKDATGVDEVPSDQVPSTKVLRDGQLLIVMPDGKTYNAQGQRVR
ncbi:MAG: InlB B-repeat-containing protein, partial [Paludibacteraceae bacterium]|nr:InlB B-repeat-containing protein [Paludibacteraceae bacterium]